MIILDTDQEVLCFTCGAPIWPAQAKTVIGILGIGQEFYVMHQECARYLAVDNPVDKSLGKMLKNE